MPVDPTLVYVRISVFGQDGPYSRRPGPRPPGHRLRGAAPPDRRTRPAAGPARRDHLGLPDGRLRGHGRGGRTLPARRRRPRLGAGPGGGRSTPPSTASILRVLEWTLAGYDRLGTVRTREGNRLPNSAPLDNYPTRRRRLRLHRGRIGCQLRPAVPGHGPARADRRPPLLDAWPSAPGTGTRSTTSWPPGRRGMPPRRSKRPASPTTCPSGRPTARPTSSPIGTWPPGAISSRSRTP